MIDFVRENEIDEIQDLIDYAMINRFDDWFRYFVITQRLS